MTDSLLSDVHQAQLLFSHTGVLIFFVQVKLWVFQAVHLKDVGLVSVVVRDTDWMANT